MASEPTTSLCDDLQPWLAAYALGEADAVPEHLAHLAGCPHCQSALADYRAVAGLLPYAAPDHEPRPALRAQIIANVERAAAEQAVRAPLPARPAGPFVPSRRRRQIFSPAAWAACAFAALAVMMLGWNLSLRSQISDQAAQISFHRQSWQTLVALLNDNTLHWYSVAGEQANGHAWLAEGGDVLCLVAQKLPPLSDGQAYQVWLEGGSNTVSGGIFPARDGNGWVLVQPGGPIDAFQRVFVTVEPAAGSATPSGPAVLSGSLQGNASPAADRSELQKIVAGTFDV